jgi:hypothetical protein
MFGVAGYLIRFGLNRKKLDFQVLPLYQSIINFLKACVTVVLPSDFWIQYTLFFLAETSF